MGNNCLLPPRHKTILEAILREGNPYGKPREDRRKPYPNMEYRREAEYLFFGGCTATYLLPEMVRDALNILQAGGVQYAFLGVEEPCCGSVLIRSGYAKDAEKLALQNLRLFEKKSVSKVITICSGCYRTFKIDYPELLGDTGFKVYHISEIISDLLSKEKIKLKKLDEAEEKVTYHDPCHLGVHCGVYDQPRNILQEIYGNCFVEMVRNRRDSRCCGAGGGVKSALPEISVAMAEQRLLDATDVGAKLLLTSCPFCLINLNDAAKQRKNDTQIIDFVHIVAKQLLNT